MFVFLAALLTYALLSFGGVVRQSWFALELLWIAGVAALLVIRVARHRSLDRSLLGFLIFCGIVLALVPAKLGVGFLAAGWAYLSARAADSGVLRFFHFLLLLGVLEALLGLTQYFFAPGWILGYINPFYRSSGTLINRNHFAGLLEMFIPVAFGLAYLSARRFGNMARVYVYLLAGAFMGLALLFSVSRMGIFSFLATACFMGMVLQFRKSHRGLAAGLELGLVGLIVAGALWIGVDVIVQRFSEIAGEEAILREGRVTVFRDAIRMIAANPSGVGTGNFQDRYRQFQTLHPELLFDHTHNDYLETAAEWGLPLALAFWTFLLYVVVRGVRLFVSIDSSEQRGILLTCTGAAFSILIHSLADFNLQIPSNAMLFFTFIGISLAMPLPGKEQATDLAD